MHSNNIQYILIIKCTFKSHSPPTFARTSSALRGQGQCLLRGGKLRKWRIERVQNACALLLHCTLVTRCCDAVGAKSSEADSSLGALRCVESFSVMCFLTRLRLSFALAFSTAPRISTCLVGATRGSALTILVRFAPPHFGSRI